MNKPDVDISLVKKLVELAEKHGLDELTVNEGGLSITIKGKPAPPPAPVFAHHEQQAPSPEPPHVTQPEPAPQEAEELAGNIYDIVAPLVGVFYRAPAPDAANFVEVGDIIEVGSEVGLIEAMKVFSPIPSEVAGEVVATPATNGKLVQQGEVLVRIRLAEE